MNKTNLLEPFLNNQLVKASKPTGKVKIYLDTKKAWIRTFINAEQFITVINKTKEIAGENEYTLTTSDKKNNSTHWFCFHAMAQKIKIYLFSFIPFDSGTHAKVFEGYKLSYNSTNKPEKKKLNKLKERILKVSEESIPLQELLLNEKRGLDNLYFLAGKKKIVGIQKKFTVLFSQNAVQLVTKKFTISLLDVLELLTPLEVYEGAKQLAIGIQEIQNVELASIDLKIDNVVLNRNSGKVKMVHIDLELYDISKIKEWIDVKTEENINNSIQAYTPDYFHMKDVYSLKECTENYIKIKDITYLKTYMEISRKVMIYQLGNIFLALIARDILTGDEPLKEKALNWDYEKIKERTKEIIQINSLKNYDQEKIKKYKEFIIKMLHTDYTQRPSIDAVIKFLEENPLEETKK